MLVSQLLAGVAGIYRMGSSPGEDSHPASPSRHVISLGNLHSFFCLCSFYSVLQGTPARWRDFHSATIIGTKMYVFGGRADRFGPFHSNNEIYCNRIKVFDTETNSWLDSPPTPVLPEGRRSHSACECGAAEGGGWWKEISACLRRDVCSAGWGCGLARGAQSPVSVESLAHHTAHEGDVSRGGQPAPLGFLFGVGSGWPSDVCAYSLQSATTGSCMYLVATMHA